jgi:hypothetical protein
MLRARRDEVDLLTIAQVLADYLLEEGAAPYQRTKPPRPGQVIEDAESTVPDPRTADELQCRVGDAHIAGSWRNRVFARQRTTRQPFIEKAGTAGEA